MQVCLPTKNDLMMSLTIFITFNIEHSDEFSWNVKFFISSKCLKHISKQAPYMNSFIKHDVGLPCVYFLIISFYIFLFFSLLNICI